MPFGGLLTVALIGAGSSIAGGVLSGQGKTTQTGTSQQTFDPATADFRNKLMPLILARLNQPQAIDPALLASGTSDINKLYNSLLPGLQSQFSSRGLGQSGILGGDINALATGRIGQIRNLIRSLQGTAEDRMASRINQALSLASPTGMTSSGTTSGPGALTGLGTGINDFGTLLGILSATGAFGGGGNSGGSSGSIPDIIAMGGGVGL